MKLEWPQIIVVILFSMNLGINLIKHGEHKDEDYNFWTAIIRTLETIFILYAGDFFE